MNTKQKPATLGAGFVTKGTAKPADATKPLEVVVAPVSAVDESTEKAASPLAAPSTEQTGEGLPSGIHPKRSLDQAAGQGVTAIGTKSLTVKVDGQTYIKLKEHGFRAGGKTNQDIFTEALAMYFKAYKI